MCGYEPLGLGTAAGVALTGVGAGGSVAPVVMRPILFPVPTVNHRLPSRPVRPGREAEGAGGDRGNLKLVDSTLRRDPAASPVQAQ